MTTTISVSPIDAPKVAAALDKMMTSPIGAKSTGRLLLIQHIADGSDPATHSIVSIYKSAAEAEAFSVAMQNDPAVIEFRNTVVPIARPQMTARSTTVKSWGDINDTDTIWNGHYLTVMDPSAFMVALNAWLDSPMGKKFPGQGHLAALSQGGIGAVNVTHVINIGYASIAEMEAYSDMVASDPDWAKFMAALRPAATHVGADLGRTLKQWGTASMKDLTKP